MAEFDPVQHELDVTKWQLRVARYALFDTLIDYALDGKCSVDEAIAEFVTEDQELGTSA